MVLIGPSFMAGLALINWFLSPFGYSHLGTSDAAKFIEVSSLAPAIVAGAVTGIIALVGMAVATVFRSGTHVSPAL